MGVLSKFALENRVAIVTGGNKGIGRGISLALAEAGADVIVAARKIDLAEEVAARIRSLGRKAMVVPADVTRNDKVVDMVEKTMQEFGRIDILVNNAGGSFSDVFDRGLVLDISESDWDGAIALNLKSVFLCSRAAARIMLNQKKGNIINIASITGQKPTYGTAAYSAAKAAVINFTESLAQEWAPCIRVNAIAPGLIFTQRTRERRSPEVLATLESDIPLGRAGQPEDVALATVYLASDASEWVTGTVIDVQGGGEKLRPHF